MLTNTVILVIINVRSILHPFLHSVRFPQPRQREHGVGWTEPGSGINPQGLVWYGLALYLRIRETCLLPNPFCFHVYIEHICSKLFGYQSLVRWFGIVFVWGLALPSWVYHGHLVKFDVCNVIVARDFR